MGGQPSSRELSTRHWFSEDLSVQALLDEHHNTEYLDAVIVEDADHLHELLERPRKDVTVIAMPPSRFRWAVVGVVAATLFMPSIEALLGHPVGQGLLERLLDLIV